MRDFVIEDSLVGKYYDVRITSGRFASVRFRYDTVTLKKRWLRTPDITFTYLILEDAYGEVPKDVERFELFARSILYTHFFSE